MILYIYNYLGTKSIGKIILEPECGKDFCDSCGDCLYCYGCDLCHESKDGKHFWVQYISQGETIPSKDGE